MPLCVLNRKQCRKRARRTLIFAEPNTDNFSAVSRLLIL